jgi:DNA polymerase III epsilon subunit-like protein
MRFAVFDTETTGLPIHKDGPLSLQPRVIEFGGIITDGHEIIRELEFICDPKMQISDEITKITGLKNSDLRGKPEFDDFIPQLQSFFMDADAYVAHNASFDRHMLQFDLRRYKKDLPYIFFPRIPICTVEETFHMYGRRMKLIELYELLVGPYVQKHRAIDDVRLLHAICQKIGLYEAFQVFEEVA